MKPKSLFLSLLFVALLALVACGGQEPPAPVPTAETATEPTPAPELEPEATATTAPEPEPIPTETTAPASPTAEPEPATEPEPEPELPPTSSAPVTFEIPPSVAASATLTTVQNTADQTNIGQPYWAILPQHLLYNFEAYALSETFHEPRLIIYPAPEFADLNPAARETISQLQTILADRPDLASEETLPLLPIFNAAQVFHAQAEYLDFGSGQGIRYLTQFDQAINPISNRTIFYTFQGLTNDGRHYVTAVLPIASPNLPDDGQLEQGAFEEFAANFESYIAETVANLNETDPASFTPPLGDLDSMMASVSVNLPAPPKRTNDSGQIVLTISRPTANAQLEIGQEQTISGYVAPGTTGSVEIALVSGVNTLISTTVAPDPTTGDWTTSLTIPNIVNGRAQITASLPDSTATQRDGLPVTLYAPFVPDGPAPDEVVIGLTRPILGESLTIGMPAFFDGRVQNPIDGTVTIAVLGENCTTFYARQEISVPDTGGQWNGILLLPSEQIPVDETACAIAYTGTYGENWRETQLPVPLLAPSAPNANHLTIGLPFNVAFQSGATATLFGGALNAPENMVAVSIVAGDESQRVLAETTTAVDDFGFWTIDVPLPDDYQGFAILNVTMPGVSADEIFSSTGITIE